MEIKNVSLVDTKHYINLLEIEKKMDEEYSFELFGHKHYKTKEDIVPLIKADIEESIKKLENIEKRNRDKPKKNKPNLTQVFKELIGVFGSVFGFFVCYSMMSVGVLDEEWLCYLFVSLGAISLYRFVEKLFKM